MHRENAKISVGFVVFQVQADLTSFFPGECVTRRTRRCHFRWAADFQGVGRVFGEYEIVFLFRTIGVFGFAVYVGTYALLAWRVFDGDSVAFFAGNTVAAALVLASNFGEFKLAIVLIQIFFIALGLCAMILRFLEETALAEPN